MKKILYLYREIMPYNVIVLRELADMGFEITVVHILKDKKTPYTPPEIDHVKFIDESNFNTRSLKDFALNYKPNLVFINDRTIYKYNSCGAYVRKKLNIPVVGGSDTQWKGGKQWLNILTARFRHHRYFTHRLVTGVRQYEYAKRQGFKDNQIIMNFYSADTKKFLKADINTEKFDGNRNFLFVGRFVPAKGLNFLLKAWKMIENKNGATLTLVGNGPLINPNNVPDNVIIHDFKNQDELIEIANKSSCFILPSIFEPWALVIHEFAAAGLPLIVTNECGATPHFVINNYNGYIVDSGSELELKKAIENVLNQNSKELFEFGKRSRQLSKKITPEIAAHSLVSVLPKSEY